MLMFFYFPPLLNVVDVLFDLSSSLSVAGKWAGKVGLQCWLEESTCSFLWNPTNVSIWTHVSFDCLTAGSMPVAIGVDGITLGIKPNIHVEIP